MTDSLPRNLVAISLNRPATQPRNALAEITHKLCQPAILGSVAALCRVWMTTLTAVVAGEAAEDRLAPAPGAVPAGAVPAAAVAAFAIVVVAFPAITAAES